MKLKTYLKVTAVAANIYGGSAMAIGVGLGNAGFAYAGIQVGPNFIHQVDDGSGVNINDNSKVGYDIGGLVGYRFNQSLRADLTIDYLRNNVDPAKLADLDVHQLVFLVNGYYDFQMGPLVPFVGAGLGYHSLGLTFGSVTASGSGLGWQVTAGANYSLQENLKLGLNYRLIGSGSDDLPITSDAGSFKSKALLNSVIAVGLTYDFGG
jgi:opacity protein-like surface antigen